MTKKILIIFTLILTICFFGYKYIYHEQRQIANEKSTFSVKLSDLETELKLGDESFNKKYLDKTIEVTGVVTEIDLPSNAILIDDKIFASFNDKENLTNIKVKVNTKIKARFIGYDDLLEKFRFDQVSVIN
jgi:hypothetical protein